jgi:hypothetical protein
MCGVPIWGWFSQPCCPCFHQAAVTSEIEVPVTPEVVEILARRFHDIYERLAPSFGYKTRKDTQVFDPTSANGKLMLAVCKEILEQK